MYGLQTKKLAFIDNGASLLHSTQVQEVKGNNKDWQENVVVAWNLTTGQPRYTCPGSLFGISRDEATFLTRRGPGFSAWDALTGIESSLASIVPHHYELHQRVLIEWQSGLTIQLSDVFDIFPPTSFQLPDRVNYTSGSLDTWMMAPNNRYIVVTLSGEIAGHDWASGESISLEQGKSGLLKGKYSYAFQVDRFRADPILDFSKEHDLMAVSDSSARLTIYSLNPWGILRGFWVDGHQQAVSFHPKHRWFLAVSAQEDVREAGQSRTLFFIQLLDIETTDASGGGKRRGVIEETGRVERLLFHPNGQYLASLLRDGAIHIWDTESSQMVAHLSLS